MEDLGASKGMTHWNNVRSYFEQEVSTSWGDLILILGCFVTGLLDSAVFNVWSCFVSMQTGTIHPSTHQKDRPSTSPAIDVASPLTRREKETLSTSASGYQDNQRANRCDGPSH